MLQLSAYQKLIEIKKTYYIFLLIIPAIVRLDNYSTSYIPKPHTSVTVKLESNMDIFQVVTQIDSLLPQFSDFINQFNNLVIQSGINVVTDSVGNISIDVPRGMPDREATQLSTRIGVIDRLITARGQELNDLFEKGMHLESDLKSKNPKYVSQLTQKIAEFERLNRSYEH